VTLLRLFLLAALVMAVVTAAGWYVFVPRPPMPGGPDAIAERNATLKDSNGQSLVVTIWQPRALKGPAPLVLYSPGWGGTRTQSRAQVENLASHGFVVVGVDDYTSDRAADPDKGASFELLTDAQTEESMRRAARHVTTQGNRIVEVLAALRDGQLPDLAGRIALDRVGVLGMSIGGPSGLAAASRDTHIVAVYNLDGGLFGAAARRIGVPNYFLMSSREAFPSDAELASPDAYTRNYARVSALDIPHNRLRMERPHGYWAQIPAAGHDDLADGLFRMRRRLPIRTNFERADINGAIGRTQVAYFRSALLGDETALRGLLGRSDQTLRWISPNSPPPGTAKARQ
jgi:predicted dienelactone hydrolase